MPNLRVGVRGGERGVDGHGRHRRVILAERVSTRRCNGHRFVGTSEESRWYRRRSLQRAVQLASGVAQLAYPVLDVIVRFVPRRTHGRRRDYVHGDSAGIEHEILHEIRLSSVSSLGVGAVSK